MCCLKPFVFSARTSTRGRGYTLIELVVSQAIALVLATGLIAFVTNITRKVHTEVAVADADSHLREASLLLLRDMQGLGSGNGRVGNLVTVSDGGIANADTLTSFQRDEALCNGGLSGIQGAARRIDINVISGLCPVSTGASVCSAAEIQSRHTMLVGASSRALSATPSVVAGAGSGCSITYDATANAPFVTQYNARYPGRCGSSCADVGAVITDLGPSVQIMLGSNYVYRIVAETLERSVDTRPFSAVMDGVFDLQVERVYDINNDGVIDELTEVERGTVPVGANSANFLGVRTGLITFGRVRDGMDIRPQALSNRIITSAPTGRRYRSSIVLATARNRGT